jgi:hypothetical protein
MRAEPSSISAVATRIYRQGRYRYNAWIMSWRTAFEIDTDAPLLALLIQLYGGRAAPAQLRFVFMEACYV